MEKAESNGSKINKGGKNIFPSSDEIIIKE
jgi:hypothetical protein